MLTLDTSNGTRLAQGHTSDGSSFHASAAELRRFMLSGSLALMSSAYPAAVLFPSTSNSYVEVAPTPSAIAEGYADQYVIGPTATDADLLWEMSRVFEYLSGNSREIEADMERALRENLWSLYE